ncbi:hypothetical protein LUW77_03175 [Streptomyces radiopugnans]|nr:hypothetical protein LUW77_03175 [Streptomyces radiopugnans]
MNILVEIDGQTRPLADCFWVRFDAKGCANGSAHPVSELETIASAQDAQLYFTPRARDRAREDKQGVRYELLTPEQWDTRAKPCLLGKCQHHPAETAAA